MLQKSCILLMDLISFIVALGSALRPELYGVLRHLIGIRQYSKPVVSIDLSIAR